MPRYNPQGHTKAYLVTTLTAGAPTASQINAGIRLDTFMVPDGISGFTAEPQTVDATDLAATREKNVPGLATTTNGAITFFRGDDSGDGEADLFDDMVAALNAAKYVVFVHSGSVATGELVDVFPSNVASVNPTPPQGGQSARFVVGFTHPAEPTLNVAIAS